MLRQLAQYHAKDPNNLFMVRLAQVGGDTQKKDKVDLRFSRASCLFLSKWPLTVASLVRPSGSDSPGQRHAHPLPVPQRPAADESGRRGRTAHRARLLPRRQEQLVHPPPPDAAFSALCSRVQRWRSISFNPPLPPCVLDSHPGEISLHSLRAGSGHAAADAGHLRRRAATAAGVGQSRTGED